MQSAQKRSRMSEWPVLFDITPLAKLILGFVPKMQVRQWVRKSSGAQQRDICSWMQKEDIDIEIHKAIFAHDNVLCAQYLPTSFSSTSSLLLFPVPNILSQLPFYEEFVQDETPLCNLKVLVTRPQWKECMTVALIQNGFKSQTNEWLEWLLNVVGKRVEVGLAFGSVFNAELWNMRQPFIANGQCTIETADPDFFATMPLDVFRSISESTAYHREKYGVLLCATCIDKSNWELAHHLYHKDLSLNLERLFDRSIAARIQNSPDALDCISDDSTFVCFENWDVNPRMHTSNQTCLDDALRFVNQPINIQQSHMTLKDVLCTWVAKLFMRVGIVDLVSMFECACILGHYYTVHAIWNFVFMAQRQYLQAKLAQCRFCDNVELLEFAWSIIGDDIRQNAMLWIRSAYNNNNCVLWKFLCDKQLIDTNLLFDTEIEIMHCTFRFDAGNIAESLGHKPVAMLVAVWDMQNMQMSNNVNVICYDALRVTNNIPVLRFLNDNNAQFSKRGLYAMAPDLPTVCQLGLTNIIAQSLCKSSQISSRLLHDCYMHASTTAREALWCVAPLLQTAIYILLNTNPSFDMCIFLLDKHAISAQECIDALKNKPEPNITLINDLESYTYCDADADHH